MLDSLVAFVDVGDDVVASAADALSLRIEGPYAAQLSADEDNLVLRAARGLADICGAPGGADLTLVKNLPVAAGLGGGSSDAAATLAALADLWRVSPDAEKISSLALALGADVPVCRAGRTARMSGIGDVVEPAPALPRCGVVLANPNRPLATAEVFAARRGAFSSTHPMPGRMATAQSLADAVNARRNDLFEPAIGLLPEIGTVIDALKADPSCLAARLSGSGPSCFGLYADAAGAERAAARIAADHPAWWVKAGSFIERSNGDPDR